MKERIEVVLRRCREEMRYLLETQRNLSRTKKKRPDENERQGTQEEAAKGQAPMIDRQGS